MEGRTPRKGDEALRLAREGGGAGADAAKTMATATHEHEHEHEHGLGHAHGHGQEGGGGAEGDDHAGLMWQNLELSLDAGLVAGYGTGFGTEAQAWGSSSSSAWNSKSPSPVPSVSGVSVSDVAAAIGGDAYGPTATHHAHPVSLTAAGYSIPPPGTDRPLIVPGFGVVYPVSRQPPPVHPPYPPAPLDLKPLAGVDEPPVAMQAHLVRAAVLPPPPLPAVVASAIAPLNPDRGNRDEGDDDDDDDDDDEAEAADDDAEDDTDASEMGGETTSRRRTRLAGGHQASKGAVAGGGSSPRVDADDVETRVGRGGSSTGKKRRHSDLYAPDGTKYRVGRWAPDEAERFVAAVDRYGRKSWREITAHVGTRSIVAVRSHAQKIYAKWDRRGHRDRASSASGGAAATATATATATGGAAAAASGSSSTEGDDGDGDVDVDDVTSESQSPRPPGSLLASAAASSTTTAAAALDTVTDVTATPPAT